MPTIFISHASADRPFALRLAHSLTHLGHTAWVDVEGIGVGDSIPQRLAEAIERADYLVLVLSNHSASSAWSEQEWQALYWEEVATRQTRVLPVVLEECPIPLFLRPKRHADFRIGFDIGLAQLAVALHEHPGRVNRQGPISNQGIIDREANDLFPATPPLSHLVPFCYDLDTMHKYGQMAEVQVELELPYIGKISGVWKPDEREQDAAWELYIELATRVSIAGLSPGDGLLRESLSSLYSIFSTARDILRKYGPAIARPKGNGELSFGFLAISVLNYGLRPVLAKWHPLLLDYEHLRDSAVSALQHEQRWERAEELRQELDRARRVLLDYSRLLAYISHIPAHILEPVAPNEYPPYISAPLDSM